MAMPGSPNSDWPAGSGASRTTGALKSNAEAPAVAHHVSAASLRGHADKANQVASIEVNVHTGAAKAEDNKVC